MGTRYPVVKGPRVVIDYQIGGGELVGTESATFPDKITYDSYILGGASQFRIQSVYFENDNTTAFRMNTTKVNGTDCQQMMYDNGQSDQYRIIEYNISQPNVQQLHVVNTNDTTFRMHNEPINDADTQQLQVDNVNNASFRMHTEPINCTDQQSIGGGLSPVKSKKIDLQDNITQSETIAESKDTDEKDTMGFNIAQSVLITNS